LKDLDEQDLIEFIGEELDSEFREILIFSDFCPEISNKFQKTRFRKETSIENVITLEGLPFFNSSMISFHIWLFEKLIHTLQNNVHILSFPIL
jgi:hypothetical protein